MGKGKKKDKGAKKEESTEVPSVEPLTLTEAQPSTSAQSAEAPKPESKPETAAQPADDEDEGGLGLGKPKRKRPPRKKKDTSSAKTEPQPPGAQPPPVERLPLGEAVQAPAPSWGAPRPQQPVQSPPGGPTFPGQPPSSSGPPQQWSGPTPQFTPGPPPGFAHAGEPSPQFAPGMAPQQPPQGPSGFPGLRPGGSAPTAQPPHGIGRGQGLRGAGPSQAPMRGPASATMSGPASATIRGPVPGPAPGSAPGPARAQGSTEVVSSRFSIPDKYPSQKGVPATKMKVLCNYMPMTIQGLMIHRYDVTFKPDKPKKMIPKAFLAVKQKQFPKHLIAFDQMKNCYALKPLPGVPNNERISYYVEVVDNNGKIMNFEVAFKSTGTVDLNVIKKHMATKGSSLNPPTEAIQCIDVILRQGTLESYIKAGRQFFKRPANPINLGDGLEMWTGLFQSAIFTSSAFLNIDVAHKGFPKQQPLIDAVMKDFRLDLGSPIEHQRGRGVENFKTFIKGLRVIATIGGDRSAKGSTREFICNELVDPPNKITFMMTDAQGKQHTMTVADYFKKEKKVSLRYPNFNCMWVGPRDKKIYYPIELLEVSYGQAMNKQLNDMQLATMVKEAATPPDERKRKIEEVIRAMNYSHSQDFKSFGLNITTEFYQVDAKVLAAPNLVVEGNGRTVQPRNGSWQANRLLQPKCLDSWVFIAIESNMNSCNGEEIISLMKQVGTSLGMKVTEPGGRLYNTSMQDFAKRLKECQDRGFKFVIVVVPTKGRDYYHKVKQIAEKEVGILTQCIKEYTCSRRMNQQTVRNILLKINSKLMGINQALDKTSTPQCLNGKVMVVGADVTHPSPDQTSVPSIAAVTASIDPRCFIYNIQLSVQTPKKEMIVEFEDMMLEHLQVYVKHNGSLPQKIFVFRDGVSEGQFAQVMNSELQAVHKAYQRLTGNNQKPEVLFLLVQKRHHTRFFNVNPRMMNQNVLPGTVVDTDIVHAKELDFYLVSHQALKGTARPTRYHAVCNDGRIPHDEVEQLTFYLCHLYSRCMRSVSYPTPTYYAHLACLRARSLTHGQRFNNADLERRPQRLTVLNRMLENSRMFFV